MTRYRSNWHREQAEKALAAWEPYIDMIERLYLQKGWSQRRLAREFRCSQTTIHRLFKRWGIKARPDARGMARRTNEQGGE